MRLASLAEGPEICEISENDWWIVLSHDCDFLSYEDDDPVLPPEGVDLE